MNQENVSDDRVIFHLLFNSCKLYVIISPIRVRYRDNLGPSLDFAEKGIVFSLVVQTMAELPQIVNLGLVLYMNLCA